MSSHSQKMFSSSERECFQHLSNPLGGLSTIVIAFQTDHLKALSTSSEECSESPGGKVDRQKQAPEGCCHAAEGKNQVRLRRLLLDQISPRCPLSALLSHRPLIPHQPLSLPGACIHWTHSHCHLDKDYSMRKRINKRSQRVCNPIVPSSCLTQTTVSCSAALAVGAFCASFFLSLKMSFGNMD